jgi:putative transcriptional regulator
VYHLVGLARAPIFERVSINPLTTITMTKTEVQAGAILMAEPFSDDYFFKRSVVLLCEHRRDGTVGFVLNNTTGLVVSDVLTDFEDDRFKLFIGGPVQQDSLHFLHTAGDLISGGMEVASGIWWGGDFDQLVTYISSGLIEPHDVRFFAGYAGWSKGQLEEELADGHWLISDMDISYLTQTPYKNLWQHALMQKGGHYSLLGALPSEEQLLFN